MPEENGDNTRIPEHMELGQGDLVENSDLPGKGVRDITVDQGMELERADMIENSSTPEVKACGITIDRGGMEADSSDEKELDSYVEEATDSFKEIGGDLSNNSDSPEVMIGQTSPRTEDSSIVGHLGKKPTTFIVGENHKFPIRSRYLSPRVGSCHDSCKFGHGNESEKKSPASGMIRGARSLMKRHSNDISKSAPKEENNKKTYVRRLSLPSSSEVKDGKVASEVKNRSIRDFSQSKLKRVQSEIKPSSIPSPGQTSRSQTEIQPRNKVVVRNLNLLESPSLGIQAIKTRKEVGSHRKSEKEKGKKPMSSSFPPTLLKKSPSMKARLYKNHKSTPRSSHRSSPKKAEIDGSGNVPEKTLYMIEPDTDKNPAKRPSRFASNDSKGNQKGSCIGHLSSPTDVSMSATYIVNKPSQLLGEERPELDSINPKGAIAEDGGSKSNIPRPKSTVEGGRSKSNKSRAKSNVEHGGSRPNTPRAKSTMNDGGSKSNTQRAKSTIGGGGSKPSTPSARSTMERKTKVKGKVSCPEEKDGSWKVRFKKGKVVVLQVATSSPKKLQFKRGRILGEDQIAQEEVILKNRGKEQHATTKQPESRKVRLRHQEASSKKDTVDLNNVIEETASKLVKTRKSKVKALVGAFERVMSLRDRKSADETS